MSQHAFAARFSSYKRSGFSEDDQQKLSRIARYARDAPAHTALRTAVSIAAAAMAYVSICEYHGQYPCARTMPLFESGNGCSIAASAFTLPRPCSGFVIVCASTSWSYCREMNEIEPIEGRANSLSKAVDMSM